MISDDPFKSRKGAMRFRFKATIQRETQRDRVDRSEQILEIKAVYLHGRKSTLSGRLPFIFDAYTIGKLPNHKGR